jgi:hypothetical protein
MEHELGARGVSESSESSEAWGGNGAELPLPTVDVHAMYARLGFIIVSGKMSAAQSKGEWKKKFAFPRGWQTTESREYDKSGSNATGFALVTGAKSGVTAIDIDDPDTPNNKRLMRLMSDCTLVARTKKGFHYVFKYDVRILQTAGDKLDTRNDGGCIFVAPSVAYDDRGRTVAEYSWVRVPDAEADGPSGANGLVAVPEPVIEFLRALDRRYVGRSGAPPHPAAPTAPRAPAALTAPMAPTALQASGAPTTPAEHTGPASQLMPPVRSAKEQAQDDGAESEDADDSIDAPCCRGSRGYRARRFPIARGGAE